MKIRFLTSIASARFSYHAGQVIEVERVSKEIASWLRPLSDGSSIAEIVKDAETAEVALAPQKTESAIVSPTRGPRRRAEALAGQHDRVSGERAEPDA